MDPLLVCDEVELRVARGGECRVPVTAHNPAEREDHYRFEILGDAARWGRMEPRHVPGIPGGGQAGVELVLRPPADAPPGTIPFAVRCVSLQDPARCAVVEGDVVVGASRDVDVVTAAVQPRGRRSGQYVVQARNRGHAAAPVLLSASDPRRELTFALAPREFTLDGGGTETAYLSVRPRRPKLAGGALTHPFVVEHRGPSGSVDRLPDRFEQRPVLGPVGATVAALLVAAVAVTGGALAWPSLRGALVQPAATASRSAPAPSSGASGALNGVLHGYYALWQVTPIGDVANQGAPARLLSSLQAAGVPARIVDSRTSPQLAGRSAPALLVVQDGFADLASAQAACTAHRDLAPACAAMAGG
jgi:hypothetical protein